MHSGGRHWQTLRLPDGAVTARPGRQHHDAEQPAAPQVQVTAVMRVLSVMVTESLQLDSFGSSAYTVPQWQWQPE